MTARGTASARGHINRCICRQLDVLVASSSALRKEYVVFAFEWCASGTDVNLKRQSELTRAEVELTVLKQTKRYSARLECVYGKIDVVFKCDRWECIAPVDRRQISNNYTITSVFISRIIIISSRSCSPPNQIIVRVSCQCHRLAPAGGSFLIESVHRSHNLPRCLGLSLTSLHLLTYPY